MRKNGSIGAPSSGLALVVVASAVFAQACTRTYVPMEYRLRSGAITAFDVVGNVTVRSAERSHAPVEVYSWGGTTLESNYRDITDVMMGQTIRELRNNGRVSADRPGKSIDLQVASLRSEYIFFFWKSAMRYRVSLGAGAWFEKQVTHSSADVQQDLNGCIAEGVMQLLSDDRVRAYLARP